jgi:multidrug efflux pump subunit AcrB
MVRFLLARPIAVGMTFLALAVFSIIVFRLLPVSLLPPIDVPQIVVRASYPNASPEAVEQNVLAPIREGLATLNGLEGLDSRAGSETGTVTLRFAHGTAMDLAYIETNEKIDRITGGLPSGLPRPQVIRTNTNDIPVVRVQAVPKDGTSLTEASLLAENVLKKRLEQLEGVSLVDINGRQERVISVTPDREALAALGMTSENVIQAIRAGNSEIPGISVEDGQYRYYLRMATRVDNPEDILRLPVTSIEGNTVSLSRVAQVKSEPGETLGHHLYNGSEGLVLTVHKQGSAKMNELLPRIYEAVEQFRIDYPQVDFDLSQDQATLLNAGISNLQTSLLFGGFFAFAVLFAFMGNYRIPVIMGISLPVSLLASFLLFYLFNISINVISLSGLALGLGMLIDNAIIVMENITRKRREGLPLFEACVQGVNEVMSALISSVLTTLAVFVPLVFLSGTAGALFYDQAVSVAAILGVSLMVAFILLPLLYMLFYRGRPAAGEKDDSRFYLSVLAGYKSLYEKVFGRPGISMALFVLLLPLLLSIFMLLPVEGMPPIEKFDAVAEIDWNAPIGAAENRDRVLSLQQSLEGHYLQAEADVGVGQFLLAGGDHSVQKASLYLKFDSEEEKDRQMARLAEMLAADYPRAAVSIGDAPNAFDQLFSSDIPYYEARWRELETKRPVDPERMDQWLGELPVREWERGPGLQKEASVVFRIDLEKLALYGIPISQLQERMQQLFGNFTVDEIKRFGEVTPIRLKGAQGDFSSVLRGSYLNGRDNIPYALANFVGFGFDEHYKNVTADKGGVYQSVSLNGSSPSSHEKAVRDWGRERDLGVDFSGQYFSDRETIRQLAGILLVSVLLLYFILSAQFESLVQSLIVVLTLPFGIGAGFLVLFLTGSSLNVMSGIGLVVMLGIMVNDAILKIDTANRLRAQYAAEGMDPGEALERALYTSGEIRLKPILMTSATTILALLPVVFSSGIGADLQRPLVYSVIGGLTIGTFTALFFVPLAYWFVARRKVRQGA